MEDLIYRFVWIMSLIFVPLPFALRLWGGWRHRIFMLGTIVLIIGKIGEGIGLSWWQAMYVAGDPIILCGSLLLLISLGGAFINEPKGVDKKIIGALWCGASVLFAVMIGMAYVIIGSNNNYYVLVSLVYFIAWVAIAIDYLEISNYHLLAFVGAFFSILSIIICFSWDGAFWAGTITEEQYGAAPWGYMYVFEALGGIFATLGMFAAGTLKKVSLPSPQITKREKVIAVAIIIATVIIISALLTDPAIMWGE